MKIRELVKYLQTLDQDMIVDPMIIGIDQLASFYDGDCYEIVPDKKYSGKSILECSDDFWDFINDARLKKVPRNKWKASFNTITPVDWVMNYDPLGERIEDSKTREWAINRAIWKIASEFREEKDWDKFICYINRYAECDKFIRTHLEKIIGAAKQQRSKDE